MGTPTEHQYNHISTTGLNFETPQMSCYIKQVKPRGKYTGSFHTNKESRGGEGWMWDRTAGLFKGEVFDHTFCIPRQQIWSSRRFLELQANQSCSLFGKLSMWSPLHSLSSFLLISFASSTLLLYSFLRIQSVSFLQSYSFILLLPSPPFFPSPLFIHLLPGPYDLLLHYLRSY